MIKGSCHCSMIQFEITEPLPRIYKCYCITCRKLSGSAFSVVSKVNEERFKLLCGSGYLHEYESKPGKFRYYCKKCCSPIYVKVIDRPGEVRIRLGVLDGNPKAEISGHIWVSEKPAWEVIHDKLPQYDEWNV